VFSLTAGHAVLHVPAIPVSWLVSHSPPSAVARLCVAPGRVRAVRFGGHGRALCEAFSPAWLVTARGGLGPVRCEGQVLWPTLVRSTGKCVNAGCGRAACVFPTMRTGTARAMSFYPALRWSSAPALRRCPADITARLI
jgi:hypothetical protein